MKEQRELSLENKKSGDMTIVFNYLKGYMRKKALACAGWHDH